MNSVVDQSQQRYQVVGQGQQRASLPQIQRVESRLADNGDGDRVAVQALNHELTERGFYHETCHASECAR